MELELIFERGLLSFGHISVNDFVHYTSRVQQLITIVGLEQNPSLESKQFKLLIKKQKPGSVIVDLIPALQSPIFGTSPVDEATEYLHNLITLLENDREGSNHPELKNMIHNISSRKSILNRLEALSRKRGSFSINLIKKPGAHPITIFKPNKKFRNTIITWKKLEQEKLTMETFTGALTIIHGEGERFIRFHDINGNLIRYRLSEKELEMYKEYFMKIVEVRGLYNKLYKRLERIEDIIVLDKKKFDKLGPLTFKKPITFTFHFREDAFFLVNKDLHLIAAGKKWKELKKDLLDEIRTHIEYFIETEKKLTSEAKEIKMNLLEIIDISEWRSLQDG